MLAMQEVRANYRVEQAAPEPEPAAPRAMAAGPERDRPVAVIVAHGMGQQVALATLDELAEGLRRTTVCASEPVARTLIVDGERVSRLELALPAADGSTRHVHLYEAYWAPLTEGEVTLRDVTRFLLTSGARSLWSGWRPFRRWLFDRFVEFPAPVRTVIYLATALAVVLSLFLVNAVLTGVVAARAALAAAPGLSPDLFADLTTTIDYLMMLFVVFGAAIAAGWQRRWPALRKAARWPSAALFVTAIAGSVVAAVVLAVTVAFHMTGPGGGSIFDRAGAAALTRVAAAVVEPALWIVVGVGLVWLVAVWLGSFIPRLLDAVLHANESGALTLAVLALGIATLGAAAAAGVWLAWPWIDESRAGTVSARLVAWPLVVLTSLYVRTFLIQYVGDVVAYVESQSLDRFNALRDRIKALVLARVTSVYDSADAYARIVVAGHSLGSVAVYDALNRLLVEDAQRDAPRGIVARTALLLTFGSPLDKTAFLFGAQGPGTEAREALAASVQPLISDPGARLPWVNVYSPWDIISGPLDYYDLPAGEPVDGSAGPPARRIENVLDPDATALLGAHVEYWKGRTIFEAILTSLE
jgi:hypothetical protein